MTRKLKNIIMGVLLILLVFFVFFIVNYAKNHTSLSNNPKGFMTDNIPPDKRTDENKHGQPPEMPSGDFEENSSENFNSKEHPPKIPNGRQNSTMQNGNIRANNLNLTIAYYILFWVAGLLISLIIIYLIISNFNKKTLKEVFKTRNKIVTFVLGSILLSFALILDIDSLTSQNIKLSKEYKEETSEKDAVNLNENNVVSSGNVDLNEYETDITIAKAGTYTFSGKFKHSIIINAKDQDIEIVLNGVEIETESTATIIGLSAKTITIKTEEGTENKLTDSGNSEYDGCIFSNAELIFEGKGKLIVNGKQNEGEGIATEAQKITINSGTIIITANDDGINAGGDGALITINGGNIYVDASGDGIDSNKDAVINGGTIFVIGSDIGGDAGIDTDEGFVINGGTIVALGSDMIEIPKDTSRQTTIAFSLSEKIDKDTLVTLMKGDEVIVSFEAPKSYKTIIISSDSLENGDYNLCKGGTNTGTLEYGVYKNSKYTKGSNIKVNNMYTFTISKTVNTFGSSR